MEYIMVICQYVAKSMNLNAIWYPSSHIMYLLIKQRKNY